MVQELVSAQVHHGFMEIPPARRLQARLWRLVLQPFVPNQTSNAPGPFLKRPQCSQHVFHMNEPDRAGSSALRSTLGPQKSPATPRNGMNLTLKPSRQHLTEEKQS